jgi:enoyl-[acyl-carrier-protein] reductase (NADH)
VRALAADLGPRGIRVNGISGRPVKPLGAAGITGEITHVDAGFNTVDMSFPADEAFD